MKEVLISYLPMIMTGLVVDLIGAWIAKSNSTTANSVLGVVVSVIKAIFKK